MRDLIEGARIGAFLALSALSAYGAHWLRPGFYTPWDQRLLYWVLVFFAALFAVRAMARIPGYYHQRRLRRRARNPAQPPGGARFANEAEMRAAGLFDPNSGPPFGMWHGRPLFYGFTHALCLAPAGTGKTTSLTVPALCHGYRIGADQTASTICVDLKRELFAQTWRLRMHQHGHRIILIDPAKEGTDSYNPLDLVSDAYRGHLPLAKAKTYADMLALKLVPEPPSDEKHKFFRNGERKIIIVCIHMVCYRRPQEANLIEVRRVILDPEALIDTLEQAIESDALGGDLAIMAKDVLGQTKHLDEFRTGASQALEPYSPAGELGPAVRVSTFRWFELKKQPMTVYLGADLAEQETFQSFLQLFTECAMIEILQAPGNRPVHVLLDEATNFSFDISKKLTALRGAGVRVQIIAQEYAEMLRVFGEHAGPTIFNQTGLKSFFGVTDLELAKRLSARLGERYVSRQSFNLGKTPWDELSASTSAQKVPLMSPARIMNMPADEQLVLVEGLRPIHCHKLPYDRVSPWLSWLGDNPVEGGKLPGPTRIRLDYTSRGVFVRGAGKQAPRRRKRRVGLPLWLLFAGFWIGLVMLGARAMGWG